MAVINNVAYSWSMITLASTALGIDEGSTTLEGVSGIKWNKTRKIESNYRLGGKPVSRGFGNLTYTASITMDYATQQALRSTYGSLMDIGEFDLIVSFANPMASDDWTTTTVTLKDVSLMKTEWSRNRTIQTLQKSFSLTRSILLSERVNSKEGAVVDTPLLFVYVLIIWVIFIINNTST